MTTDDQTLKLLQASVDMLNMGKEIADLRAQVRRLESEKVVLLCKLSRATLLFDGLGEVT
jgi:hypothetical protein